MNFNPKIISLILFLLSFKAHSQYTDSVVADSKCNAYRLVTFPIGQEYCFYKEYVGDALIGTGYLKEAASKSEHYSNMKDSIINTYDISGKLVSRQTIHDGTVIYEEQYINGIIKKRMRSLSNAGYADSSTTEIFITGKLSEKRLIFNNKMTVTKFDSNGNVVDTFSLHQSTSRTYQSGDTTWTDNYYFSALKLGSRHAFIGGNEIISMEYSSDFGTNRLHIVKFYKDNKAYKILNYKLDSSIESVEYIDGKYVFDVSFYYEKIKGYSMETDEGRKIVIENHNCDSLICVINAGDVLEYTYWLNKKPLIRKYLLPDKKNLGSIHRPLQLDNLSAIQSVLALEEPSSEGIFGKVQFSKIIYLYDDGSVNYLHIKGHNLHPGGNEKGMYIFSKGEMQEKNLEDSMPDIRKDLKTCMFGVRVKDRWIVEPEFENAEILKKNDNIYYGTMMFRSLNKDSSYIVNRQGKIIIRGLRHTNVKIIKPELSFSKAFNCKDTDIIFISNEHSIQYYTLRGQFIYGYAEPDATIHATESKGFIVRKDSVSIIKRFDGTEWTFIGKGWVVPIGVDMKWAYSQSEDGKGCLISEAGKKIPFLKIYQTDQKDFMIITTSAILSFDKDKKINEVLKTDEGLLIAELNVKDHFWSFSFQKPENLWVISKKGKFGIFDINKSTYIQPTVFDTLNMENHMFKKKGKWGLFSQDYKRFRFSGYDQIKSHSDLSYIVRKGNKSYLIDTNSKYLHKNAFDQIVMIPRFFTIYLFRGKIDWELTHKVNPADMDERLKTRLIWVVEQTYGSGKSGAYGIMNRKEMIVPCQFDKLNEVRNNVSHLNRDIQDYSLAYEMRKGNEKYSYNYFDGLKNLSNDYKLSGNISDYQVSIDKVGRIVSRSCYWNPAIDPKTTLIAFNKESDFLWQSTALPKDSSDTEYSNGTWIINSLAKNIQLPDTFESPNNYHYSANTHIIKTRNGKWNLYNNQNLNLYSINGFDDYVAAGNYIYVKKGQKNYVVRPYDLRSDMLELPSSTSVYTYDDIYTFSKDTVWKQNDINSTPQVIFTPGKWWLDSAELARENNPEYIYKHEPKDYLRNLRELSDLYQMRYKNRPSRSVSTHYFPSIEYYLRKKPVSRNDDNWANQVNNFTFLESSGSAYDDEQKFPSPITLEDLSNGYLQKEPHSQTIVGNVFNLSDGGYSTLLLYITAKGGLYKFNLYSVIDYSKITAFNNFLFGRLSKLEHLDFPCLPNSDFVKYFNSNFEVTEEGLLLKDRDSNKFKFTIAELTPYLSTWAKQNIFSKAASSEKK
jgi:hypothetical protein